MSKFGFDKLLDTMEEVKRDLPVIMANQAQNHFLDAFKKQGFNGQSWPEVQRRIPGTKAYRWPSKPKQSSRTSPILVRRGLLRRAVSSSVKVATFPLIRLVVSRPGAKAINEGDTHMPKRQFMGDNPLLRAKQIALIRKYVMNRLWPNK